MINKYFYQRGGSEKYMFDLINLLKSNGHEVIEFSMQHPKNLPSAYSEYFIKNIDFSKNEGFLKYLLKAGHAIFSFKASAKLEELIKKTKPDIAHLHNFNFQLTPSILFTLKKYNIPIVWTLHDYKFLCPNFRLFTKNQVCERCKKYKYYNCFLYNCLNNSRPLSFLATIEMYLHKIILDSYKLIDAFIVPSKFLLEKVRQWGYPTDKFAQIYNCLNLTEYQPATQPGEGILYFGRLSPEKGLISLLTALKSLPHIKLEIAGEGPQKTELMKFVADNRMDNVEFVGFKQGSELYDLIKKSRLIVVPSVWYENNPISIIEAMALAKPVLGAKIGGITELINNLKTGILFQPGDSEDLFDKLKIYYNQVEILNDLGKSSRNFVLEKCSYSVHYQEIDKLYRTLAKKQT